MASKIKVSFLIPVHNEEKILASALDSLLMQPTDNYEVILGLDGCTDRSEEIVKQYASMYKNIHYYKLNLRQGKPAVIDVIIKKAKGEIIIINDADWVFTVKSKSDWKKMLALFDDKKVGAIAESFPVEWDRQRLRSSNWVFKMIAYSSYFWFDFNKKKFSEKASSELSTVTNPESFLTNIFPRKLYSKNSTLGDDYERTIDIFDKGKKVILFNNDSMPRMIVNYNTVRLKDFYKQKLRTALARKQLLQSRKRKTHKTNVHSQAVLHVLKDGFRHGIYIGSLMILYVLIMASTEIIAKFKKADTRKGWTMRLQR